VTRRSTLLLVAVAATVRLIGFAQHLGAPLVAHPVLDGRYFDLAARAFAAGGVATGLVTGFRPLLYPRLLALVYRAAGDWDLYAALGLQHVAGIATALLVAWLAARLFRSDGAGLAAGLLYALAGPPLFFEGELLVETLFLLVVTAQLVALARAGEAEGRSAVGWALVAGLLVALGVRLRPNHLLFLALLPLLLVRPATHRRRLTAVTACGTAALVGWLALAAWERPLLRRFELLPGAGGVNLYLGNKRGADGMIPRQDWSVTYADDYRDSVEVFAEQAYRRDHGLAATATIPPAALTRYWLGRSRDELVADPLGRIGLLARKALLLVWNAEIPNNRSFAFATREEEPLLGWLPVRFGVLLALALAGVAVASREQRRRLGFAATVLFVGAHAAGVVLFFVNDRYRLPLWPPLAALAGGGAAVVFERLRAQSWRELARPLGAAALGTLLSFPNWSQATLPGPGRDLLFRSTALLELGRLDEARRDAERAAALEPHEVSAALALGNVCRAQGDPGCAESSYRRALALHPNHTAALTYLGSIREDRGDVGTAHELYCAAIAAEPGFAPALEAAARLELRAGLAAAAAEHLAALPARRRARTKVAGEGEPLPPESIRPCPGGAARVSSPAPR